MKDVIIVGAGFAGATLANLFANANKKVLVIDKRSHIGGNMYEEVRDNGVRIISMDLIFFIQMIKKCLNIYKNSLVLFL